MFYNYNIIDEVQVAGLGAAAEYGGFSGAGDQHDHEVGSNGYPGLFEGRFTNKDLASRTSPTNS